MYYWLTQTKGLFVLCKYVCVMTETTETLKKNWTPVLWIALGEIPLRSHSACLCVCVLETSMVTPYFSCLTWTRYPSLRL